MTQQDMDQTGCLAGCDRSPRDPAAQPTPGQLIHSLHSMSGEEQIGMAQRMLEASDTAVRCFTRDHEGRLARDDDDRAQLLWLHAEAVWGWRQESARASAEGQAADRYRDDSELTLWLYAESQWKREQLRADLADAVQMVKLCTGHPDTGAPSHFDLIQSAEASRRDWAAEAMRLQHVVDQMLAGVHNTGRTFGLGGAVHPGVSHPDLAFDPVQRMSVQEVPVDRTGPLVGIEADGAESRAVHPEADR